MPMTELAASKTIRFALVCMGMDLCLIVFATSMLITGNNVPYVPEFFGVQGLIFGGVAGKNFGDNYISYKQQVSTSTSYQTGLAAPPTPNPTSNPVAPTATPAPSATPAVATDLSAGPQ